MTLSKTMTKCVSQQGLEVSITTLNYYAVVILTFPDAKPHLNFILSVIA
jgi:hypothetical protein